MNTVYGIKSDQLLELVNEHFRQQPKEIPYIRVRWALDVQQPQPRTVAFLADCPTPEIAWEPRPARTYANAKLIDLKLTSGELSQLIDELMSGHVSVKGLDIHPDPARNDIVRESRPFSNSFSDSPGALYRIRTNWTTTRNEPPLVDADLPTYPNIFAAAADWLGLNEFGSDSYGWIGEIRLFLPELRARIDHVHVDGARAIVRVKRHDAARNDIRLKGSCTYSDRIEHFEIAPDQNDVAFDLKEDVRRVQMFLLDGDSHVYDYLDEGMYTHTGATRIVLQPASIGEQPAPIETLIRNGEGPKIEFKAFVEPHSPKHLEDFVETVIAFANTTGGQILIGVRDDGTPHNISSAIYKCLKDSSVDGTSIEERYWRLLRQKLNDLLTKNIDVDMDTVEHKDAKIVLITVREGSQKPYFNRLTKDTFIRCGASDLKADPDQDMPAFYRASPLE